MLSIFVRAPSVVKVNTKYSWDVSGSPKLCQVALICMMVRWIETKSELRAHILCYCSFTVYLPENKLCFRYIEFIVVNFSMIYFLAPHGPRDINMTIHTSRADTMRVSYNQRLVNIVWLSAQSQIPVPITSENLLY